jgi:hypothetical protein
VFAGMAHRLPHGKFRHQELVSSHSTSRQDLEFSVRSCATPCN